MASRSQEQQGAVFCALPLTPPCPGRQGQRQRGLGGPTVSLWLRRCADCRSCCRRGEEREGGTARRLAEFLAGVRRTKIKAGRYKAGWTRLSMGGRKRRATALVVETQTGSQGRGASLGVAGDSDSWGPDDRTSDAPPLRFRKWGSSSRPPSIFADPWMAMTR